MKISETLAHEIEMLINPLSSDGLLMPKTAEEIFKTGENWFPQFDAQSNITGFFEYRTHEDTALAEMGSVLVLKPRAGIGKCLLQIFNTQKDIRAASGGFAVTKDFKTAHDFFAQQTGGDVSTQFPSWFKREQSDRHFVQWR